MNQQKTIEFNKAVDFLDNHPAINFGNCTFFNGNFNWWASQVCKRGEIKLDYEKEDEMIVTLYKNHYRFNEFVDEYKDDDDDINDEFISITVPYSVFYGEPWKYHKTIWKGEFSFYKYDGDEHSYHSKREKFHGYHGKMFKSNSFENLVIECAKVVKIFYGNFCYNDFLSEEEKENHKANSALNFIEFENINGRKMYEMKSNENYMPVFDSQLNQRWWNWFRTTKEYKKNWNGE